METGRLFFADGLCGGESIGYAPYSRFAFRCSDDEKKAIRNGNIQFVGHDLVEALDYYEVFNGNVADSAQSRRQLPDAKCPTGLMTILMTTRCSLKCIYCYANAGGAVTVPMDAVQASVDVVSDEAVRAGARALRVKIHGGGEPTVGSGRLAEVVEYSRQRAIACGLKSWLGLTTNGVMPREIAQWVSENFDAVTVSCDGIPSVQNTHRPMRIQSRQPSSELATQTILALRERDALRGIRATVTSLSVSFMAESIRYFADLGVRRVNFEPVALVGRAELSDLLPTAQGFVAGFADAKTIGDRSGVAVSYSGVSVCRLIPVHCGGYGSNFVLTPSGDISVCYEVFQPDHPLTKDFFVGSASGGRVVIDPQAVARAQGNVPSECSHCIAVAHCGGGCRARRLSASPESIRSQAVKCAISAELIRRQLAELLSLSPVRYCRVPTTADVRIPRSMHTRVALTATPY